MVDIGSDLANFLGISVDFHHSYDSLHDHVYNAYGSYNGPTRVC
jgi:hypothetical protein